MDQKLQNIIEQILDNTKESDDNDLYRDLFVRVPRNSYNTLREYIRKHYRKYLFEKRED
jgi:hypothetical protein